MASGISNTINTLLFQVHVSNEYISLSNSKSYMRGEIGYVRNKSLLVCLSEYL